MNIIFSSYLSIFNETQDFARHPPSFVEERSEGSQGGMNRLQQSRMTLRWTWALRLWPVSFLTGREKAAETQGQGWHSYSGGEGQTAPHRQGDLPSGGSGTFSSHWDSGSFLCLLLLPYPASSFSFKWTHPRSLFSCLSGSIHTAHLQRCLSPNAYYCKAQRPVYHLYGLYCSVPCLRQDPIWAIQDPGERFSETIIPLLLRTLSAHLAWLLVPKAPFFHKASSPQLWLSFPQRQETWTLRLLFSRVTPSPHPTTYASVFQNRFQWLARILLLYLNNSILLSIFLEISGFYLLSPSLRPLAQGWVLSRKVTTSPLSQWQFCIP
jgi:hypothetical protein